MAFRCSQCNFRSQFESALTMHEQLHHEDDTFGESCSPLAQKTSTLTLGACKAGNFRNSSAYLKTSSKGDGRHNKNFDHGIPLQRTNSASKFFDKLRLKMSRSKPALSVTLEDETPSKMSLPETSVDQDGGDSSPYSRTRPKPKKDGQFLCHLCSFSADRITLLDRHLLDDHKIGLDNLLKLLMAKTKASDVDPNYSHCQTRKPYYQRPEREEDLDTVTIFERVRNGGPKELKTVATNTDAAPKDSGTSLKDSCNEVTRQLEEMLSVPLEKFPQSDLLSKMVSLNECMCNIIDNSGNVGVAGSDAEQQVPQRRDENEFDLDMFLRADSKEEDTAIAKLNSWLGAGRSRTTKDPTADVKKTSPGKVYQSLEPIYTPLKKIF